MELSGAVALAPGSLIPSMTAVKLPGGKPVNLRPADANGRQGRNWALAAMLPEGTTSWDVTAVAGADTSAADPRLRRLDAKGDLILADSHYGTIGTVQKTSEWIGERVLTLDGALALIGDPSYANRPLKEVADELGVDEQTLCDAGEGFCGLAPRLVAKQASLDLVGDEASARSPTTAMAAAN
ncbi:hypothetical protein G6F65_019611 [Rhizopus arrhizus]|nr:hypothetical protein G6F65_019611 [Rhizopus arrhizus]